ncbi:TPR repeats containing protein [Salinisphaera sp. T5B8]|uniref:hypothetical protein n=1 Tax=Salinisphaera sp. T5B8 TaxID=1304154 RepID=UPI00333E6597
MKKMLIGVLLALWLPLANAADTMDVRLLDLQHEWAHVNYEIQGDDAQAKAFEALEQRAAELVADYPNRAEPLIWDGIILSSQAGAQGGLGALGLVKRARKDYEQAITIDSRALAGSAHTSLGVLYYKVPGWPIGFGSDDKAEAQLKKALAINPHGIDPNYFYAQYLAEEKADYRSALQYLDRALAAPRRPERPVADAGRRAEIRALRDDVEAHLGH